MKEAIGRWRITSMEVWDNDFLNAEVPAHITLNKNMKGNFQFGHVQSDIDRRASQEDSALIFDFSWAGFDENHPASGRGWLEITGNSGSGCFYIHMGDESNFTVTLEELSTS